MPSDPQNPQVALHSELPVGASLIVVFVPSADRNGVEVDQEYWVDEILTALAQLFRGATAYPRGRGVGETTNTAEHSFEKSRSSYSPTQVPMQ